MSDQETASSLFDEVKHLEARLAKFAGILEQQGNLLNRLEDERQRLYAENFRLKKHLQAMAQSDWTLPSSFKNAAREALRTRSDVTTS